MPRDGLPPSSVYSQIETAQAVTDVEPIGPQARRGSSVRITRDRTHDRGEHVVDACCGALTRTQPEAPVVRGRRGAAAST